MIKISMEDACNKLHWHDSWSKSTSYNAEKRELIIEIHLCECEDCANLLFSGQEGMLIFHGVSSFEIDTIIPSENPDIEFKVHDCLSNDTKMGLLLAGYAYKDVKTRSYDWFTLRFFADYATWHPKNL